MLIRLRIRRREQPIPYSVASTVSIVISVCLGLLILCAFGVNPIKALIDAFIEPLFTSYGWASILTNGLILLLCGIGLVIAFRAGVWNIGAEGQLLLGAIAATWVALYLMPDKPAYVVIPTMFILGFLFGGAWGTIAGILKAKLNVNEVLSTMMLNYVAYQLVYYLVMGPWENPVTHYPVSKPFPPSARLPKISPRFPVAIPTLIIALVSVALVYVLLFYTKFGYELRAVGSNPEAAKAYGISYNKVVILAMFLSGGLAGLAGVHAVAGSYTPQLRRPEQVARGYGFIAILVAWLAGLNPVAVLLTSVLMGAIFLAGFSIQALFRTGIGVTHVFTGCLLLALSVMETARRYHITMSLELPEFLRFPTRHHRGD